MKYLVNPGDVFGYLTVVERVPTPKGRSGRRAPYYRCACEYCENTEYVATSGDLRTGRILSCGCWRNSQEFADKYVDHGNSRRNKGVVTQAYESWLEMKKRCDNPRAKNYPWYGGKGISYDPKWKRFRPFWLDMGSTEEGMTLDRIDSSLDYSKENCRWVTKSFNSSRK